MKPPRHLRELAGVRALKVVLVEARRERRVPGDPPIFLEGRLRLKRGRWIGMLTIEQADDESLVGRRIMINLVASTTTVKRIWRNVLRKLRDIVTGPIVCVAGDVYGCDW